jgi:hypothetical protein
VCTLHSMLHFSITLPEMTPSGHRRAGITITVGLIDAVPVGWSAAALTAVVLWSLAVHPDEWKPTLLFAFYAGMTGWSGVGRFFVCMNLARVVFSPVMTVLGAAPYQECH